MAPQLATTVQELMDIRNDAQRAVELFVFHNYPIDSDEKQARLNALSRAAAIAEHDLRMYVRRRR